MNPSSLYPILKSLHLIFVVTWFAGLFYLVRLFIYDMEAREARVRGEQKQSSTLMLLQQFAVMERRLWFAITVPSAWAVLFVGVGLMILVRAWEMSWFHAKIALLLGLYAYHLYCGVLRRRLSETVESERLPAGVPSSKQLRAWNEVATLFLVAIVSLAVTKSFVTSLGFLAGLCVLMGIGFGIYVRRRSSR